MSNEKSFLVDVGFKGLPFPFRVTSKVKAEGQETIGEISATARIMKEFESQWIDKFIQVLHSHRDSIGTETLKRNVFDYLRELNATTVTVDFHYPYFIEEAYAGIPGKVARAVSLCLLRQGSGALHRSTNQVQDRSPGDHIISVEQRARR